MTKIKICGLSRERDIDAVNDAGADYAGFILLFPRSHRNIGEERAALLRERLLPGIRAVCVFADRPPEDVIRAARRVRPDVIQLHGGEDDAYIRLIRERTGAEIWKAFRVRSEEDLAAAERSGADLVLLDNGYGTGQTFDWRKARGFARPFALAGGLTPENIPDAAELLAPEIVDLSSGVETERVKDPDRILAAVRAAHGARGPAERTGRKGTI